MVASKRQLQNTTVNHSEEEIWSAMQWQLKWKKDSKNISSQKTTNKVNNKKWTRKLKTKKMKSDSKDAMKYDKFIFYWIFLQVLNVL